MLGNFYYAKLRISERKAKGKLVFILLFFDSFTADAKVEVKCHRSLPAKTTRG
jgi:hypothetical protein